MKSFKKLINESNLDVIIKKWENLGITLFVYESPKLINISSIIVPKEQRKSGIGSEIMKSLVDYADSVNKMTIVTPGIKDDYHGTTSQSRLKKFYKRFGFVENKGKHKDFRINATDMYRPSKGDN